MLKALELFGFKSFADKTKFEFSAGLTAVVGPNGSGKSNVVDALKWILGDQSPKSLRGKEMTDVIFNGSTARKASSFAEARLVLDNSSGFLDLDANEVQIGRRLWRSGDSEYLINQQTVRLRDIRDLLLGSGAGSSAYCIIEQGRVDQILQANASTRRLVFDEAAGISRYKARKVEAERKLERVEQNLLRLKDIVAEVDSQLNTVRGQATRAARYRDLSGQLRRLWVGLAADDYRLLDHRWQAIEGRSRVREQKLEQLQSRQQQVQSELRRFDDALTASEKEGRAVEQQLAECREAIASGEATIRLQTDRKRELQQELKRSQRQRRTHEQRSGESDAEHRKLARLVESGEAEFQQQQRSLQQSEEAIRCCEETVNEQRGHAERLRQEVMQKVREISEKQGRISHLADRTGQFQEQLDELGRQRLDADAELLKQMEESSRLQDALHAAQDELSSAESAVRGLQDSRDILLSEQRDMQQSLAEMRETRSGWEARRSVLEDMEKRQEGLGIGVREILQRAAGSTYHPWTEVLGSVADLLEVDLDHAALLEVALGTQSQLVVVTSLQPFVDYVQKDKTLISGRVGFVAVDAMELGSDGSRNARSRLTPAAADLSDVSGIVMRADELARSHASAPGLARHLLADTWVVETLDRAVALSRTEGRGCRFVTLQGELLEKGGRLFVGSLHGEHALVSRKSELRRLRNDLIRLARSMEDESHRLETLAGRLREEKDLLTDAELLLTRLSDQLAGARRDCDRQQQKLESWQHEQQRLIDALGATEEQTARTKQEHDEAEASLLQSKKELQQLQQGAEQAERAAVTAESEVQELKLDHAGVAGKLQKQSGQLEESRRILARLETERKQRAEERSLAITEAETCAQRLRMVNLELLNCRSRLNEQLVQVERLSGLGQEHFEDRLRIRSQRSSIQDEDESIRTERRTIDDENHHDEIGKRDLRHQMQTLESRIREEFQLELSSLRDSSESAFLDYLRDQETDGAMDSSESGSMPTSVIDAPEAFTRVRNELEEELEGLRRKLKHLGHVNTDSLSSLADLETRYASMSEQLQDLEEARDALEEIVRRINTESRRLFLEAFTTVREHFRELFRRLFGGGEGDLILEDPDDVLECGIEIVARPPGKELRSLSLLSGGEKTLTAVALLLAMFQACPSPFCLLDEVDAALDEANVDRFVQVLKGFQNSTQFIMITHRKPSMAAADVLYGVTMEEAGISKRMSVRFDQIVETGFLDQAPESSDGTQAA